MGGSAIKFRLKYKDSERNRIYTEVCFYIHQLILVPETTHYFGHLLIQWCGADHFTRKANINSLFLLLLRTVLSCVFVFEDIHTT